MKKFDPFDFPEEQIPKHSKVVNVVCFFDVVEFTKETTNKDMQNIIRKIEEDMSDLLYNGFNWNEKGRDKYDEPIHNDLILIPTGDGYGIGFNPGLDDKRILDTITSIYKQLLADNGLKIRMGVAKGPNVRHIDKNDVVNLFGYGINLAARVINVAKPNQILLHSVYAEELGQATKMSDLCKIEKPMPSKHGESIIVYNYYRSGEFGIPHPKQ
ncbi:MAG: hypothetical protein ABSA71_06095 [Desulfomonilia bacterium]|jgi:hypothetical protein